MMSESEVESEAEKVIECEEETVSEGTLYNERSSLSQEECEQIQEEISQVERPENYLEGDFTNYSECSSYLRNQMSLRYNYVIKFLGENPGACPWDEAKKYFSKSLMSISSEYTLQI